MVAVSKLHKTKIFFFFCKLPVLFIRETNGALNSNRKNYTEIDIICNTSLQYILIAIFCNHKLSYLQ